MKALESLVICLSVLSEKGEGLVVEEIKKLEASIARRKGLLSNENYVNKAPSHVVENDRLSLEKEEAKLQDLLNKLN